MADKKIRDETSKMKYLARIFGGAAIFFLTGSILAGAGFLITNFTRGPAVKIALVTESPNETAKKQAVKSLEERIKEAYERSAHVKGVYMTAVAANDKGRAAAKLRNDILHLLETTELNGLVIDIKETDGVFLPDSLKDFVSELHRRNVWVIARLVVFNDTEQAKKRPEVALKRANGRLWLDRRGNAWLDPASREVWDYIAGISKKAIDYGFDEIQFDYIRFPSDGDVQNIVYPVFRAKERQKYEVLRDFFQYLNRTLKAYKPEIIISADLFGYVAIQKNDLGIGQRMDDLGDSFDYISFMVYPSHYYNGFYVDADLERGLPALNYPYRSKNTAIVAANRPYDVVYRTLLTAKDFLAGKDVFNKATITPNGNAASTTPQAAPELKARSQAKLRPWLQDFNLDADTARGIYYDAKKVRAQIDAAEAAGSYGWLLWNASNVYTKEALKPKGAN